MRFNLSDNALNRIAYHATKCVCLYWIILEFTATGKKNAHLFNFSDFVIACLSTMQNGLSIDNRLSHYPITLVEPHDLLKARNFERIFELPEHVIPSFLHGKKRVQAGAVRLSIKHALQTAIVDEKGIARAPQIIKREHRTGSRIYQIDFIIHSGYRVRWRYRSFCFYRGWPPCNFPLSPVLSFVPV